MTTTSPGTEPRASSSSQFYNPPEGWPESSSASQQLANIYEAGDINDQHNLAKRPRDWRADYVPHRSILATLKSLSLKRPKDHPLLAYDYDGKTRKLNTQLLYNPSRPPIDWDLRTPGVRVRTSADSGFSLPNWQEPAFQPPAMKARIIHPRLPWYIDVVPIQHVYPYITVGDVLNYIAMQLHQTIMMRHYWNDDLGQRERREVAVAFRRRCDGNVVKRSWGVVQMDFLGKQVVLKGLWEGENGMWIMETKERKRY